MKVINCRLQTPFPRARLRGGQPLSSQSRNISIHFREIFSFPFSVVRPHNSTDFDSAFAEGTKGTTPTTPSWCGYQLAHPGTLIDV